MIETVLLLKDPSLTRIVIVLLEGEGSNLSLRYTREESMDW